MPHFIWVPMYKNKSQLLRILWRLAKCSKYFCMWTRLCVRVWIRSNSSMWTSQRSVACARA